MSDIERKAIAAVDAWLDEIENSSTRRERFISQTPVGASAWLYEAAKVAARALRRENDEGAS
jgi:hypothetical protein